jgi:hypothetical protein
MIIGVEQRHDMTLPCIRIFSDATTSELALEEIRPWAFVNHYAPIPIALLVTAFRDGKERFFSRACSDRAVAAAGRRIYAESIGVALEGEHAQGAVAIDVLSSAYAVGTCREAAEAEMRRSHPQALIFVLAIGCGDPSNTRRADVAAPLLQLRPQN